MRDFIDELAGTGGAIATARIRAWIEMQFPPTPALPDELTHELFDYGGFAESAKHARTSALAARALPSFHNVAPHCAWLPLAGINPGLPRWWISAPAAAEATRLSQATKRSLRN